MFLLCPNWPPLIISMRTHFYPTSSKLGKAIQTVKKKAKCPQLSQEARAAINAHCCQAAQNYRNDLGEAWKKIDKVTENLAATHHKSIHRVQSELHMGSMTTKREHKKTNAWNAFCWKKSQDKENGNALLFCGRPCTDFAWILVDCGTSTTHGKDVLQDLVHNHHDEYKLLTAQEQKVLIQEFEEFKATKAKGFRVSTRARVNDVTHTLGAVENEVAFLFPLQRSKVDNNPFSCS